MWARSRLCLVVVLLAWVSDALVADAPAQGLPLAFVERGLPVPQYTCACPLSSGGVGSIAHQSVVTVTETVTLSPTDPSAPHTVYVTVTPSPSITTHIRVVSGHSVPPPPSTVTVTEPGYSGPPSIVTVTQTQSGPGGGVQTLTTTVVSSSAATRPDTIASSSDGAKDADAGTYTGISTSVPPPGAHYCHHRTCYNTNGNPVTTLPPPTSTSCSVVSTEMHTVYNTVTHTVFGGVATTSLGVGNATSSSSHAGTVSSMMARQVRMVGEGSKLRAS